MNIAVIAGDGIGPEVTAEAIRVLRALEKGGQGPRLEFTEFPWGTAHYLSTGRMAPEGFTDTLRAHDAILLGAIGDPRVPDHITLWGLLLPMRQIFDLYVNLRPARTLAGVPCPLRGFGPGERPIDITFIRENTEGEYSGQGARFYTGTEREVVLQHAAFSRVGVERILRYGFDLARKTGRRLTSVSKGNALNFSAVFWDQVWNELRREYADVQTDSVLVDAMALHLVRDPGRFQVVVASNLFADILTDLGAGITGGLGLAASAEINPQGGVPGVFEPVHGSAPDIAGKGVANPLAAILSAGMLCEHNGLQAWGQAIEQAVAAVLADPHAPRTPDLGGRAGTKDVTDAVIGRLG
ncbi:MAG TPA: isocitrate/isopropylmalate dehydrogenase family protein [Bacillota bacterium]|nr:isocitrate/isopropylmalate dehydrogenase family protein [Bacillota bacterium]